MKVKYRKTKGKTLCEHCLEYIKEGEPSIVITGRTESTTLHGEPCFLDMIEALQVQITRAQLLEEADNDEA